MSDVPNGWGSATMGAVTLPVCTANPKEDPDDEITYVDIGSIDNALNIVVNPKRVLGRDAPSRARQRLAMGDTVFSTVRTYLRNIGYIDNSLDGAIGSTGFCVLRPAIGINSKYLFYYCLTRQFVDGLSAQMRGTSYPAVVDSQVRDMPILVAPSAEQQRIVAAIEEEFSQIDAGVTALERARKNLRRMRAAVLESLLVAGDQNPWPNADLGSVLWKGRYGTSTKCGYEGHGLPVIRIPNVQSGAIDLSDMKRAMDESVDLSGALVAEDDVLIIRTNGSRTLIGRAAVVGPQSEPMAFASYLIQLQFDRSRIDPRYLVTTLGAPSMRKRIEHLAATSAGQYNISLDKLRSLAIPLPPIDEQQRQFSEASQSLSKIAGLEVIVSETTLNQDRLRSAILAAAFEGKLVRPCSDDEPASALLEQIAATNSSSNGHKAARKSPAKVTA